MSKYDEFGVIYNWVVKMGMVFEDSRTRQAILRRKNGGTFTFEEHVKGMFLSLISPQRPWKQIEDNMSNLMEIMHNFDMKSLMVESPDSLTNKICNIHCGNRNIHNQMEAFFYNVNMMKKTESAYGTLDKWVTDGEPYIVAYRIAHGTSGFRCFGEALALQYLKNIGVDTVKPDIHIRRIYNRLNWIMDENVDTYKVLEVTHEIAQQYGIMDFEVGEAIWLYGAVGYGEMCTADPKCSKCPVTKCIYK